MDHKMFWVGILAFTSSFITIPSFAQSIPQDKISFFCQQLEDPKNGEIVPVTLAYVPQRRENVPIIYWTSGDFETSGWTNEARCEIVSQKFQTFYDGSLLDYLIPGEIDGYQVICAADQDNGEKCNQENLLLTLKPGKSGTEMLQELKYITENKTNSSGSIYLSSGKNSEDSPSSDQQVYLSMDKFLMEAPAVKNSNRF